MSFLFEHALADAIYRVAATGDVDCAVAFWGAGAERVFGDLKGRRLRIICNLRMGGTNPEVIRKLKPVAQVRHFDTLHAKVYLGAASAVVTSANASANGLGVEEASPATWAEAGCLTDHTDAIRDWFNNLWNQSSPVTDADLEAAEIAWAKRNRLSRSIIRSLTPSFADYSAGEKDFPLLAWWLTYGTYYVNLENLEPLPAAERDALEDAIVKGIGLEDEADRPYLSEGRWVLDSWLRGNGVLGRRQPALMRLGRTLEAAGGFDEDGANQPVALSSANQSNRPFDERDPVFVEAFRELIQRPRYADLRKMDYEGAWFAPRAEMMRQFWRELKGVYRRMAARA